MSRWKSYHITSLQAEGGEHLRAEVIFDPDHPLYRGHFPGRPVTPGVCIIGLIGDVVSRGTGRSMRLAQAGTIKFHNPLVPQPEQTVSVEIRYRTEENGDLIAKAVVVDGHTKYCSLNGRYSLEATSTGTI